MKVYDASLGGVASAARHAVGAIYAIENLLFDNPTRDFASAASHVIGTIYYS